MTRRLNILILTQEDYLAGSTYSVFYLANGLAQKGHSVYVAAKSDSLLHNLIKNSNVSFLPITLKSRFDLKAIRQIRYWVHLFNINIVNAQSSKDRYLSVFSRWLYRLPVKVIHTRRQISLSIGGPLQNLVYVNGTDKIIAVGNGVKESLMNGGVPEDHIKVIYNGTPKYKFDTIDTEYIQKLKARFRIEKNDMVIGCISRRKLQEQLLRSLDHLQKPAKVILVGIEKDDQLERIISEFQFPHEVYSRSSCLELHKAL